MDKLTAKKTDRSNCVTVNAITGALIQVRSDRQIEHLGVFTEI